MKKIKKEYFSLTVQRRTGGGKLARPVIPSVEIKKAEEALNISIEQGLKYVYIGNLPGHEGNCTYCPSCGELTIQRVGLRIIDFRLTTDGKCKKCGMKLPGDFSSFEINRFG